jgi:hypothetical protein
MLSFLPSDCDYNLGHNGGTLIDCSLCSTPCKGSSNENCGGPGAVSLYADFSGEFPPLVPVPAASAGGWNWIGCFPYAIEYFLFPPYSLLTNVCFLFVTSDNSASSATRTLQHRINQPGQNITAESCVALCQGAEYTIAGLEYGHECCMLFLIVSTPSYFLLIFIIGCGNAIRNGAQINTGSCTLTCDQDRYVRCGGSKSLDVYAPQIS